MPNVIDKDWIAAFPALQALDEADLHRLAAGSHRLSLPAKRTIFGAGTAPDHHLLLLSGNVRVQQIAENGREIVLYRVSAGESCVMTTAFLLAGLEHHAEGIAETAVEAVAVPRTLFDDMLARSAVFRRFVFDTYSRRMTDLFLVIEEVAFRRLDIRLAQLLLRRAGDSKHVHSTHQQLATELGSTREVVSRQLQEFQRRDWLRLGRGEISLLDTAAIRALAETQ
ncbi:Crp/Fnr family transcriptional regulator [Algiphilus aromaticivorans]|jgi:CRP/FNR family transcriptional regulator|uniref:Crp/Fnr family transcriptional regulator n=1 Tax=Algiphilus aromaticivorans TaxID=382454 RepID=UPI0005C1B87D|nr:Crp/Fnr family transcriptional regulator [Algiphilus aromaticivorans]